MTCNFCSFLSARKRIEKEKRRVLLKAKDGWIEVWSYALDSFGNSKDIRDEEISYLGLTFHCSCDEDN
jgi:hypothetical protein